MFEIFKSRKTKELETELQNLENTLKELEIDHKMKKEALGRMLTMALEFQRRCHNSEFHGVEPGNFQEYHDLQADAMTKFEKGLAELLP